MKLHPTLTPPNQHYQTVTAYDENSVEINGIRFTHSLVVLPKVAPAPWPVANFAELAPHHFAQIETSTPDVVIFGTGQRQRFIHPQLIAKLAEKRIGVECMNNQAACRTYNILMAEDRNVALALLFENAV